MITRLCIVALASSFLLPASAFAAPDISGNVVLANMDRYPVTLRIGPARRDVQPRKASVIKPGALPLTVEYWSGNTTAGWKKQVIKSPGVYGFNFRRGHWSVAELKKGKTARAAPPKSQKTLNPEK